MSKNKTKVVAEPGRLDFTITREFDAPRELVFKAHTDPELFKQWMGPRRLAMDLKTFNAVTGGSWRYISREQDGSGAEYGFHGVFHEVFFPERIIQTFEFEGLPEAGHASLGSARFEALPGGRCRVTSISVFLTQENREGMLQAGMEQGLSETYERLDDLLAKESK